MRKRAKKDGAPVEVATGADEAVEIQQRRAKREPGFSVTSDRAVVRPAAEEKDLGTLLKKETEPGDGRVSEMDAAKKVGWRKMDVVLDEQVPICKDYHDTGYCTFGASCKFMHIRDDVLNSSQLERKLAMERYKKLQEQRKRMEETAQQPDVCPICQSFYKDAVITRCGHKFCCKCAMERYKKDHTCAVCGADTNGVFNSVS